MKKVYLRYVRVKKQGLKILKDDNKLYTYYLNLSKLPDKKFLNNIDENLISYLKDFYYKKINFNNFKSNIFEQTQYFYF
jgi:hypothetical protein